MMHMIYTRIIPPLLFKINPKLIHGIVAGGGELVARIPGVLFILCKFFGVETDRTKISAFGVGSTHPLGLSAGFDKDARGVDVQ